VSQQVDSNLVEFARRWGRKFTRYRRFLEELPMEVRLVHLVFYQSLLLSGCEVVGRGRNTYNVYLRCGDRLILIVMREVKEEVEQLRPLSEDEIKGLVDRLLSVSVKISCDPFGDIIPEFYVLRGEPIYLMNFEDIPLYLYDVSVHSRSRDNSVDFDIYVSTPSSSGSMLEFVIVGCEYKFRSGVACSVSSRSRETILALKGYSYLMQLSSEKIKAAEKAVVEALGKNYRVMDDLLRNAEEVLSNGIKALVTMLLY
jgi:hypothetical protein